MNNRELKFRYYDAVLKKIVYSSEWDTSDNPLSYFFRSAKSFAHETIIQQYTGMKDINNKEIYEGDVIQLENSPYLYEVVWDTWRWGIDSKGKVTDFIQGFTSAVEDRAIVVGNVFENPELLK